MAKKGWYISMAMDLDTMWCREFTQMLSQLKANNPVFNLQEVQVPAEAQGKIEHLNMCYIRGITTEYYDKLNDTEVRLFGRNKLFRRKFDYRGEFIKKDGNYELEPVTVPHDCVAVISDKKIGVPNAFKNDEGFDYVDMVAKKDDDGTLLYGGYLYIIPKIYCYKLNLTALVLSIDKLRTYYEGVRLATITGYDIFIYIIPYRPVSSAVHRYRVLSTKTSIDYTDEIEAIKSMWYNMQFIFPPELCTTESGYKGRENMAYEVQPMVLDEYIRYDEENSMGTDDTELNYAEALDNNEE